MSRKLHTTNLANPQNPNLNLECTDYVCLSRTRSVKLLTRVVYLVMLLKWVIRQWEPFHWELCTTILSLVSVSGALGVC